MRKTSSQIANEVFFKTAGLSDHFPKTLGHLQRLKEALGKKFEEKLFKTLEEKSQAIAARPEGEQGLLRRIGKNKTASQLGDEVLEKLSTSRWREAIRSGEIMPGPEAEALKSRMGVDPVREAEGLIKGWRGRAEARGIPAIELSNFRKYLDPARQAFQGDSEARKMLVQHAKALQGLSTMASPAGVLPNGVSASLPAMESMLVAGASPKQLPRYLTNPAFRHEIHGAILGHEGSEMSASRNMDLSDFAQGHNVYRKGLAPEISAVTAGAGVKGLNRLGEMLGKPEIAPPELSRLMALHSPMGGITAGSHADARVLLEEIRNTRMLSPETQQFMTNLRHRTGELPGIRAATGYHLGAGAPKNMLILGRIPKGRMGEIAQKVHAEQAARGTQLGGLFDTAVKSPLAGIKALIRARLH